MRKTLIYIVPFLCCFCTKAPEEMEYKKDATNDTVVNISEELYIEKGHVSNYKISKGIKFQFKSMTAVNFLNGKLKTVSEQTKKEVASESVVIFEISDTNSFKNLFEHASMQYSQDDAVQYLCGQLVNDIIIEQGGKTFTSNGLQYEGVMDANNNRIRMIIFFKGIDLQKQYTLKYNDRLFDTGLIILKQQTKHSNYDS